MKYSQLSFGVVSVLFVEVDYWLEVGVFHGVLGGHTLSVVVCHHLHKEVKSFF